MSNRQALLLLAGWVAVSCGLILLRDFGRRWLNRRQRARGEKETRWPGAD